MAPPREPFTQSLARVGLSTQTSQTSLFPCPAGSAQVLFPHKATPDLHPVALGLDDLYSPIPDYHTPGRIWKAVAWDMREGYGSLTMRVTDTGKMSKQFHPLCLGLLFGKWGGDSTCLEVWGADPERHGAQG